MTPSWTKRLGSYGIWRQGSDLDGPLAAHLEHLGFGSIWVGGSPSGDLVLIEELLDATEHITVATGIVNIWATDPVVVVASYRRIAEKHPGRFLLGVGVGHPEASGQDAARPFEPLVRYLDALDAAGVPRDELVLAALGPRVLRLAAERTAGAHPYLVTPEFNRGARELLGDALLATEQHVVLSPNPQVAREVGRASLHNYLRMRNYVTNFGRMGFSDDDVAGAGSDHFVDEIIVSGDDDTIRARLGAHLDNGADTVTVQLIHAPGEDVYEAFRRLAGILGLS
ncbi:TIGR03620 family F420-dependent LLM class oxidoreductase [Subtercola frigoramans]|uniref:F420-dependent oxidoreductase n=1 Tax=Subtercola frigoramans TaxID=120298 RepID=A0ABS2L7S5_9MICO|nr:TIGR03620 family F420-dependent LLM class oxidoreductase [Subtercola frigoramans]MBM7473156.1 putative F420-dependent oxidoreductase [Subtercola frigoramans]